MTCADVSEADQVGQLLLQVHSGSLVTYSRSEDLMLNQPTGSVALIILANHESPAVLRRLLAWLRNRWPRCPVTVVGNTGCGETEMAAREGGACYLTRPVPEEHWAAVLSGALGLATRNGSRSRL
jgi:hypothetical protein